MSFVTGIIGGFQAASAAKKAAAAREQGAVAAGDIYGQGVADANPILDSAYNAYAPQQIEAATNAGNQVGEAAEGAAGAILDSSGRAIAGMNDAVNRGNAYFDTYINGGKDAYASLQDLIQNGFKFSAANMEADPGYQARLEAQQKAIERSAAARGGVMGGGTLKSLTRYQGDMAAQEYQAAFNRNMAQQNAKLASLGQLINTGLTASSRASDNLMSGAQYTGTVGMQGQSLANNYRTTAATYGANAMLDANARVGNARLSLGQMQAGNIMSAADAKANARMAAAEARAGGYTGAAAGWNQALSAIGSGVDAAVTGGFGGGGGFSLGGMMRGMAGVPRRRVGTPGGTY